MSNYNDIENKVCHYINVDRSDGSSFAFIVLAYIIGILIYLGVR